MTLHIASMIPDRSFEESPLISALSQIAMELAKIRDHPMQNKLPVLDMVFLLSSRQEQPEFEGLRLHSFIKATQTLRIESAVPEKMVNSIHAERYVTAVLQDAIDAADEYFSEQRILFDAPGHFGLLKLITAKQHTAMN